MYKPYGKTKNQTNLQTQQKQKNTTNLQTHTQKYFYKLAAKKTTNKKDNKFWNITAKQ